MKTLFLDTETTGLHPPEDKVVEIAIADSDGRVLLDTLVNPGRPIGFATTIHHITDEMVSSAPFFESLLPDIQRIVRGNNIVIYNAGFDTKFFPDKLTGAGKISCAMLKFAPMFGETDARRGSYKWQKLANAAKHIGYRWEGNAHRALADVLATRALWHWMEHQSTGPARPQFSVQECPHCATKNRIPKSRDPESAKCGKCGRPFGLARRT
ncbi:MAG: 3'-5' exonuclease [Chromatiales bacterium]|nr:3'-5' exonuclease [Chromatiales bacterium]